MDIPAQNTTSEELLYFCNSIQEKLNLLPFQVLFFPDYFCTVDEIKFDFDSFNKFCIDSLEEKKNIHLFSGEYYFVFNIFKDDGTNVRERIILESSFLNKIISSLELFIFNTLNDLILKKEPNMFKNVKSDIGTYFYFKRDLGSPYTP